jgi:DNA-binding FadR family transcriptional regulator
MKFTASGQRTSELAKEATTHRASLHQIVAWDIGERILSGEFAPGCVLPTEQKWSRAHNVGRSAVREAVKMLAAKGLIVSRPKTGSRVEPRNVWNLLDRDVLAWYCATNEFWQVSANMQQIRRIFEPAAAALAAIANTPAGFIHINAAVEELRQADSLAAWSAADVRFHKAILSSAGNELLLAFGFLIEYALSNIFDYLSRHGHDHDLRQTLSLHEDILVAIRLRRPQAARRAVLKLLDDTDRAVDLWRRSVRPGLIERRRGGGWRDGRN